MADALSLPTPLPPPPRNVSPRGRGARVLLRIVALLVLLFALACVVYFVLTVIWYFNGTETTGVAQSVHNERGSRTSVDYLDYTYDSPQGTIQAKQAIDHEIFEHMEIATLIKPIRVRVRYFHAGPIHISALPEYASLGWELAKPGLFAILVIGIAAAAFWTSWINGTPEWDYLRFGRATLGTVTGKRKAFGRFTRFLVQYSYESAPGAPEHGEVMTSRPLWDSAQPGDRVTVLIHPQNEKRSIVYEYSVVKVIPA